MVGSVKSNAGHSEPVGGLVSVVKVLLAMENGILPPNLHFKNPNPDIPSLKDGRVKVIFMQFLIKLIEVHPVSKVMLDYRL